MSVGAFVHQVAWLARLHCGRTPCRPACSRGQGAAPNTPDQAVASQVGEVAPHGRAVHRQNLGEISDRDEALVGKAIDDLLLSEGWQHRRPPLRALETARRRALVSVVHANRS
ncbi:MAG TPA: hypothetical protein VFS32_12185 [Candidatus Limnocylindrales bacterium]|nr:hypothetical protein [Candidatus Limnocylindrales bacterium]